MSYLYFSQNTLLLDSQVNTTSDIHASTIYTKARFSTFSTKTSLAHNNFL